MELEPVRGNWLDYCISHVPDHPTKLDDDGKMLVALHTYLKFYDDYVYSACMILFADSCVLCPKCLVVQSLHGAKYSIL